jgi:Thioredoxin domain
MGFWLKMGFKPKVGKQLKKVEVLIFGAQPPCSRCFLAERNAREAAADFPEGLITVEKVDAWSERAQKFRITMTPTTVINGEKAAVGKVLDRTELKEMIQKIVAGFDD